MPASPRLAELMRRLNASTDPTALRAFAETVRDRPPAPDQPGEQARRTSCEILRAAGTAYVAQAGGIGQREALAMLLG